MYERGFLFKFSSGIRSTASPVFSSLKNLLPLQDFDTVITHLSRLIRRRKRGGGRCYHAKRNSTIFRRNLPQKKFRSNTKQFPVSQVAEKEDFF